MSMPENDAKLENLVDTMWWLLGGCRSIRDLAAGLDKVFTNVGLNRSLEFFESKSAWNVAEVVLSDIIEIANRCLKKVKEAKKFMDD